MNRILEITVGLPRSGKTTYARARANVPIVNPDSIRYAIHGQRFFGPGEPFVWATAYAMAEALFLAGHGHILVDATNVTAVQRERWQSLATRLGATFVPTLIDTSPGECIRRARALDDEYIVPVIERMAGEWDLPRPASWAGWEPVGRVGPDVRP